MLPVTFFLVIAVAVAILRFWNLGDINVLEKIWDAFLWALAVVLLGAVFIQVIGFLDRSVAVESSERFIARQASQMAPSSVRAEDLAAAEGAIPEMEEPEMEGVKGRPPEELAAAMRNLSEKKPA